MFEQTFKNIDDIVKFHNVVDGIFLPSFYVKAKQKQEQN
jgi:hypothetical protein